MTISYILGIMYVMDTYTISATELKEKVSEVLNRVYFEKREALVKRHGKPIAKIVPVNVKENGKDMAAVLKKYYGIWKDEPWAKKIGKPSRHFRKRKPLFL